MPQIFTNSPWGHALELLLRVGVARCWRRQLHAQTLALVRAARFYVRDCCNDDVNGPSCMC